MTIGRSAVVCALALLLVSSAVAQKPNLVVINLDDAAYSEFGFSARLFNQPTEFETPNIDSLAAQGSIISNGYSSYPVCSGSRAGLLTGIHQSRFGFEYNVSDGQFQDGLTNDQRIIPSYLEDLGYATGAIGKWHVGMELGKNRPLDLGFDEFYGFLGGGRNYWSYQGTPGAAFVMRRGNAAIEATWASEGDPSRYDPVKGRYLTDALGEEASDFITRHAQDETPFFLYLALNAPHVPLHAKQADLDRFAHIADPKQQKLAAMMYAADRAVGDVMSALENNGVDENTVVVLVNDNGGTTPYDNDPFRGGKGQLWEGGIRVPFIVRAPGIEPGVYDRPVSTLDLLPTLVSLAGGDVAALETDGVDMLPFLSGQYAGDPHDALHWRSAGNRFAVRVGDWKLTRPEPSQYAPRLYDLAADPGERTNLATQRPEVVEQLLIELTNWEAQLERPRWYSFGSPTFNKFDHFVFRSETSVSANWSDANQWRQVSGQQATLMREDAYANAVLEFRTNNSRGYVAYNDMTRATLQTFMLNELRFTGDYTGDADHSAVIAGNDLLFVKNLDGLGPRIRLQATAPSVAGDFSFYLENDLQLHAHLEISGGGNQPFVIVGDIADFDQPRGITKTGSSSVRLTGLNTYRGDTTVREGELSITRPYLADSADLRLFPGALIELDFSGVDTIRSLYIDGISQVSGIWGAIGNPAADFHTDLILGDGLLLVSAVRRPGDFNGDVVVNTSDYVVLRKAMEHGAAAELLDEWITSFETTTSGLPGDFNGDAVVDSADYLLLRKGLGAAYDQVHYNRWLANFGARAGAAAGQQELVPEPATMFFCAVACLAAIIRRTNRQRVK